MKDEEKEDFELYKKKFKLLYEIANNEYKSEIEWSKHIEDKVHKLFTVLNIVYSYVN